MGETVNKTWSPPPGKIKRCLTRKKLVEFKLTTKTALNKHTKTELVEEVVRLQELIRNVAIEMGFAASAKGGEHGFNLHFVSNTATLIEAGWSLNL